jgi:hypothetical protein
MNQNRTMNETELTRQQELDRLFFNYIDREDAKNGLIWNTLPTRKQVRKQLVDYKQYLLQYSLSQAEYADMITAYEGYLMVKLMFSRPARKMKPSAEHRLSRRWMAV